MITVKRKLNVQIVARGRKTIRPHDANSDSANKTKPPARIPRIARLMALAIHYQEMLRTREANDMIELSRRAKVSQPRMSQIMALKLLAPRHPRGFVECTAAIKRQAVPARKKAFGRSRAHWNGRNSESPGKRYWLQRTPLTRKLNACF